MASVDYPALTSYVNRLYDEDHAVLTTEMLGTHLTTHLAMLNDKGEDPDPVLTEMLFINPMFHLTHFPVMIDRTAFTITWENGLVCECPMIILMRRLYYDHFYRQ
ncbi:hypothetical protein [Vibrio phage VP4B]|uniref:Uncharacterized protein n=1 Tax=Vibrio phage VP4B TaxID=1262540 RepID=V9M026_9CAUD|nr:hypothetical protein FDJ61_gp072 [Vibrio phage VP4B]AGB07186.1 hypothetical protein [Vibrio phage VP4B]